MLVKKGKGFVNSFINNLPFELHLPGAAFTGPGTKLNLRLNEDLTPKPWSKPVNRVDEVAYKHDVCYLKNKDTATRNQVCDKNMLHELDDIKNPSIRERIERGIVKPFITAKKTFGLGIDGYIYCVKCKSKTESIELKTITNKKGRPVLTGKCIVCGINKYKFLKI